MFSDGDTASERADAKVVLGLTFSDPSLSLESGRGLVFFLSCQAQEQIDERSFPALDDLNLLPLPLTKCFFFFLFADAFTDFSTALHQRSCKWRIKNLQ